MDKEMFEFKENVDAWVKEIRNEVGTITDVSNVVEENINNTQHNYELVLELKDEIEELRQELNAMKLIQIVALRDKKGIKRN